MASIIIPAHNEEHVIANTLLPLLPGLDQGEYEVIVVCNGCTDRTADEVASVGEGRVRCIETDTPSKTNALNLGDRAATRFPRIYQDADVVLTGETVRRLVQVLDENHFLAASPTMRMDYTGSSWAVRGFYEVWQALPYVQEGMIGTGIFALSQEGRQRFDQFPDIIADDGFVRALFKSHERVSVKNCYSIVRSPTDLEGLIKIKTRSRLGRYELREKFSHLLANEEKDYGNAMFDLLGKPRLWSKIPVYFFVNMVARMRAKRALQDSGFTGWERDESSRQKVGLQAD